MYQAGVAECRWAIEKEDAAANAYRLNNIEKAIVFKEDCNKLLERVMSVSFCHVVFYI